MKQFGSFDEEQKQFLYVWPDSQKIIEMISEDRNSYANFDSNEPLRISSTGLPIMIRTSLILHTLITESFQFQNYIYLILYIPLINRASQI